MPRELEALSLHHHDLPIERESLVRFCRHLTGDPSQAEDLAQETLLRAWRHAGQLRHPDRRDAWLKAIARNLYRRSIRDQRSSGAPLVVDEVVDGSDGHANAEPADAFDLDVELDRQDLASLLDRAMALLPAETRRILVERFVLESSLAETADRLGLSEGAVAMRLQRGRLALRRVLVTAFPEGLKSYGIDPRKCNEEWKATRIWCPWCGEQRLEGILVRDLGVFRLRCPSCGQLNNSRCVELFASAAGHRSALIRLLEWTDKLYKYSFDQHSVPCDGCGTVLPLRKDRPRLDPPTPELLAGDPPPVIWRKELSRDRTVISYYCPRCHLGTWNGQVWNLLGLPEARAFWRAHPRIRLLPDREVEAKGQAAVVTGFESVTGGDRLDIVYARDSLVLLGVRGAGRRS